ncbi:MAG: aspartate aminotransferase family protein [Spirochaetes bacterium]|nr:aspartate aminotransferase family protein [Spirochaetota bacterium]MBU1082101.1 aspartate aminotransferase family protein [Spirochaetota bacterium]
MLTNLPKEGRPFEDVLAELDGFGEDDPAYKEAKTWSLVYYRDADYTAFLEEAYGKYFSANGLNPTAFKSLKRFERDVLRVSAELFNGNDDACGVMTSGGTESCLLAVKTYRDLGRSRGIRRPEMVIPETAHVAWDKGAEYFGVRIRRAPLAADYGVDPEAVRRLVNRRTVMILGSAPEYPHGVIDPIGRLGEIAVAAGVPLHVDACVGGYLLPFIERLGAVLPPWDFRVPGVSSISADIHKYGFAAKGASCILYRSLETFKHQVFVNQDWPGGVFASPALLGTRPGGAYAAAWAALQANGEDGYVELARRTMDATARLMAGVSAIPGLEIIGKPKASLFSFRSTDPALNVFALGDEMERKGWHIDRLQRPDALHAMVTASHGRVVDAYLADLAAAAARVRAHPELAESGQAATYGMISHIPLRGMVRKQVLDMFASSYRLSAGEIDLSDGAALGGGTGGEAGPGSKPGVVQRLVSWYVKRGQARDARG